MSDIGTSVALHQLTAVFAAVSRVCLIVLLVLFIAWLYVVVDILRGEFRNNSDKMIGSCLSC
jgi:hypothetical protein